MYRVKFFSLYIASRCSGLNLTEKKLQICLTELRNCRFCASPLVQTIDFIEEGLICVSIEITNHCCSEFLLCLLKKMLLSAHLMSGVSSSYHIVDIVSLNCPKQWRKFCEKCRREMYNLGKKRWKTLMNSYINSFNNTFVKP